jgi:hypothetical protein
MFRRRLSTSKDRSGWPFLISSCAITILVYLNTSHVSVQTSFQWHVGWWWKMIGLWCQVWQCCEQLTERAITECRSNSENGSSADGCQGPHDCSCQKPSAGRTLFKYKTIASSSSHMHPFQLPSSENLEIQAIPAVRIDKRIDSPSVAYYFSHLTQWS